MAAGEGGAGQSSRSIFAISRGGGGFPAGNVLILTASRFRRIPFKLPVLVSESAGVVPVPSGIGPGEELRRTFVTGLPCAERVKAIQQLCDEFMVLIF